MDESGGLTGGGLHTQQQQSNVKRDYEMTRES